MNNYITEAFTNTESGLNGELNNLTVNCLNSKNNKFNLDCEGNLVVNSITTRTSSGTSTGLTFDDIYPVGTYYETSDGNFNPNVSWFGSWILDSKGFLTVGLDESQTEFRYLGQIGGSKFIQDHVHKTYLSGGGTEAADCTGYSWDPSTARPYIITTGVQNIEVGHSGNLQPYIVVNRWHRVA